MVKVIDILELGIAVTYDVKTKDEDKEEVTEDDLKDYEYTIVSTIRSRVL